MAPIAPAREGRGVPPLYVATGISPGSKIDEVEGGSEWGSATFFFFAAIGRRSKRRGEMGGEEVAHPQSINAAGGTFHQ